MNKPIVARSYKIREWPASDRPSRRIDVVGATSLSDAELLVLLTGLPDIETAQALLVRSGGLLGIARMQPTELRQLVAGVGRARAAAIAAAIEFGKRVAMLPGLDRLQVKSPLAIGPMLQLEMGGLDHEEMRVVNLDTKNRVLSVDTVYAGSVNAAIVRVGELFRPAVKWNAPAVILCHNHPSGDPQPNPEDLLVTREAAQAGQLLDIQLLDHLVVARGGYVSLREKFGSVWNNGR